MALIPTFHVGLTGGKPTQALCATGDTADVGDGRGVVFKNTSGSSVTVTILVPGNTVNDEDTPDTEYTVPATTGEVWARMFDYYADPSDGEAHITYSATGTGITRAAIKV